VINGSRKVLPLYSVGHVPPLTALAASAYSTMLFPEDGDEEGLDRIACAQAICLDWRARFEGGSIQEELPVVRRELFAVLDFARRVPFQKLLSLRQEGMSAGEILTYVLLLDKDCGVDASVRRAVDLTEKFEPVGRRTLMSRWEKFKGVSHLWAAYEYTRAGFRMMPADGTDAAWFNFLKDPRPMLATAGHFRTWATQHVPRKGSVATTLEAASTWDTPSQIGPLPGAAFLDPELLYTGLKPEARELLERYRRK
jgi:hypothetical protein